MAEIKVEKPNKQKSTLSLPLLRIQVQPRLMHPDIKNTINSRHDSAPKHQEK